MAQDRFKQAEDEFFRLKGQLATGRITPQEFTTALETAAREGIHRLDGIRIRKP